MKNFFPSSLAPRSPMSGSIRRLLKARGRKSGLPPGTLVFIGEKPEQPVRISVIDYEPQRLDTYEVDSVEEVFPLRDTDSVTWINVTGVHDVGIVQQLGTHFGIDSLILEDIVNTAQRPKIEELRDDQLYLVLRMLSYHQESRTTASEQISLIVGPRYVLCFQEAEGDVFEPVRTRLKTNRGQIRHRGADYLAYSLLDIIVDHYFVVLEQLGELSEALEEQLLSDIQPELQGELNALRRELLFTRRTVWPVREMLTQLERSGTPLVEPETRRFFQDTDDHAVQVIEIVETLREYVAELNDLYMSILSNRLNETMRFLTVIGTIFIPLTFVVGVYGMNFEYMPELGIRWAYPIVLVSMLLIAAGMIVYFRHRHWI